MTFPSKRSISALLLSGLCAAGVAGCQSSSNEPATRPAAPEVGLTERQRETRRASGSLWGTIAHLPTQAEWFYTDMSDRITGAPETYAKQLEAKQAPDLRRQAMMELSDRPWGQKPPYTTRYAQIVREPEADSLLRASAIRALNRSREAGHEDLFVSGLSDESELVRLESVKALNRLPDPDAVPELMKLAAKPDENKDIRIAAAEALRHHRQLEVARTLIRLLNERDFGIAWQAHRSLRDLTQKDFGYDEAAWLAYLSGPDKPLG